MIDELHAASTAVKATLERYLNACLAVGNQYELGGSLSGERIINELQQIEFYESQIDESRIILRKFRNRRSDIAPISSLPPELLSRVFLLARKTEPCFLEEAAHLNCLPESLESLLHVCSYWRSVALALPALWIHIDIAPHHMLNKRLLTCGKLFAANAGQAPLEIHIGVSGTTRYPSRKDDLFEFCTSIATRTKSLLISLDVLGGDEGAIIERFLANSVPRTLTRLIIGLSHGWKGFIAANDSETPHGNVVRWLDIPHHYLEEVLRYVTVLRLYAVYPYWTSQAYHGLTKLHLTDPAGLITVSQLASILCTSPQLRFFYFGSSITNDDAVPSPVHLNDLEVFHLDIQEPLVTRDSILRMISPSSKPLRMSITLGEDEITSLIESEWGRFFTRSNIAQLRLYSPLGDISLPLPELLALVPNLQALSLDGFDPSHFKPSSGPVDSRGPVGTRLTVLHLTSSTINPETFRYIAETYPIQRITIDEGTCWVESGGDPCNCRRLEFCKDELLEVRGAINFVSGVDPVKEEDWD